MLQPPPAKYGGRHTVTLIPGDGIGPELLNHVREVFRLDGMTKKKQNKPWRDVDGINVTDGSWCRLPVCLAGSAVSQWTSRWCTSTPRWRLTTTWTTPSWPSAATESPSKARGAVLSVSQTQKQCVEIHQLEMWLCKKTETVQLYVTLWPPLIGNIETKHTMAPSVKSRNNVLR